MTTMPKMPRARSSKPTHPCVCGCGLPTKRTWFPGHDGRATGWARRVNAGLLTMEQVPETERAGAILMLDRNHGKKVERPMTSAERKALRKAERAAAKVAAAAAANVPPIDVEQPDTMVA